jgi:acyl dehydratase
MFARAVGDDNPIYRDADYAAATEVGSIIAPPTFGMASAQFDPDYPLRPKPGEDWWGSGRTAGVTQRAGRLHGEQHFTYHRPVRPGDVLSARTHEGKTWEKQGRSGKLVFEELITDLVDEQGEVVVSMRSVGVITEGPKGDDK